MSTHNLCFEQKIHNLCFEQKYEKYQNFYLKIFIFLVVKFSIYLNRCVFVISICMPVALTSDQSMNVHIPSLYFQMLLQ